MPDSKTIGEKVRELFLQFYGLPSSITEKPRLSAVLYFLISVVIEITLTRIFGSFSNSPNLLNWKEDTFRPFVLLVFSSSVYYYLSLPRSVGSTINRLYDNHVFVDTKIDIDNNVQKLFSNSRLKLLHLTLSLATGLGAFCYFQFFYNNTPYWFEIHYIPYLWNIFHITVSGYIIWGIAFDLVLYIIIINNTLTKNKVVVYKLHPDNGGGWGSLGEFSLHFTNLIFLFGLVLVAFTANSINRGLIKTDYLLMAMLIVYVSAVPLLFYGSLRFVHKAMKFFRDDLLQKNAEWYIHKHFEIIENYLQKPEFNIELQVKEMDSIQHLAEHVDAYPIWPFPSGITRLNLLLKIIPAIISIIQLLK